jgi:5'-methylthioadenosine phosphorylase
MLGIIAGSGLYEIEGLSFEESVNADTVYGKPSGSILRYKYEGRDVFFLPRHGKNHNLPPHRVNYRANIRAFKDLGVQEIISLSAVGGIRADLEPGSIVIADQLLDFTKSRINTFFDGDDVVHVDFTAPYCSEMRDILLGASRKAGLKVFDGGTYAAVEGPRLETAAEIAFFKSAGADMVGMTAMPEAALAREAEMCYSGIYVVTNYAAGISKGRLTTGEVVETMRSSSASTQVLLSLSIRLFDGNRSCPCMDALKNARL